MSQIAILFRRERAWAAALVIALTVAIVGAVIMNGQNQFAEAAAASVSIASKTIALQTDADGNVKADVGDTVRVSVNVNNTDGGCNAIGVETYVTADMTAYGGASDQELTCITDNGGTADQFRLDFVIEDAGVIDGIDVAGGDASSAVDVTATDIDDGAGITAASNNMIVAVDTIAPIVTNGNISISGASGTAGAYKIGDTVTATWDGGESGDDEGAEVTAVTVDFSQFGGGSSVSASADGDFNWTASYVISAGAVDTTNRNVTVTATDNASNDTTTADTTNATVDSIAPTVTDGNISISGASGLVGYKIGDTVTATWNNTAGGDNNSDTVASVTVNFTEFGGGAAVVASNSFGTWTATFAIVAGAIDDAGNNVSVTVTDNAGNVTTTSDTTGATVDSIDPIVTAANIAIDDSACTGTTGECIVGDTMKFTWNGSGEGGDGNLDSFEDVSMDLTNFGGDVYATMNDDGEGGDDVAADGVWTVSLTVSEGSIDAAGVSVDGMTVIDNSGNTSNCGASVDTAAIDNNSPTVTNGNISISGASGT
ncbi:hypothetical protein EBS80_03885, partial [bacterium]|nr:hypothetical protein [bacterium]